MYRFLLGLITGATIGSIIALWLFSFMDVPAQIRNALTLKNAFMLSSSKEQSMRFEFFHRAKDSRHKYTVIRTAWDDCPVHAKEVSLEYIRNFIDYDLSKGQQSLIKDNSRIIREILVLSQKEALISTDKKNMAIKIEEHLKNNGID